jgi:hypothetical protein
MRPNTVLTIVLPAAIVIGLAIGVAIEHNARLRVSAEHKALELQLDQMASVIAANAQLSNRVALATTPQSLPDDQSRELLRLRGEVGLLRQQAGELETVRAENRQAHTVLESSQAAKAAATADYWPRDAWAFTGSASPDAALQTSLWAASSGDLKALTATATCDVLKEMEEEFAGKSETEASTRAMDNVLGIKSVRILNREVQGEDTVVLTAAIESRTDAQTGKLVMKKIGNEWKFSGHPR